MGINEQLANQVAAEGGTPVDPSVPHFAISEEMRGHIEQVDELYRRGKHHHIAQPIGDAAYGFA